jgi:hypothetical protein
MEPSAECETHYREVTPLARWWVQVLPTFPQREPACAVAAPQAGESPHCEQSKASQDAQYDWDSHPEESQDEVRSPNSQGGKKRERPSTVIN